MTLEQAIQAVRRVGSLEVVAGAIHYEIRRRGPEVVEALKTLKAGKSEALALLSQVRSQSQIEPLESVLKGRAVELWSDTVGRLFLVADEEDARVAMNRYAVGRGEIYLAGEVRVVVSIRDPATVAEIHAWKREFDGTISTLLGPKAT